MELSSMEEKSNKKKLMSVLCLIAIISIVYFKIQKDSILKTYDSYYKEKELFFPQSEREGDALPPNNAIFSENMLL